MAAIRDAEITVVGGGAIGCAVLHHLAEAGHRDLQLIEAGQLAGATSGQAAGLVGQVRTTLDRTKLAMASVALFGRLQDASPWPIDWRQTGSLRIATTQERLPEFRSMVEVAEQAGLEVEWLDRAALADRAPMLDVRGVTAALWCPTDGYLQPNSLTTAYAQLARSQGATIATDTRVVDVLVRDRAVVGLATDGGHDPHGDGRQRGRPVGVAAGAAGRAGPAHRARPPRVLHQRAGRGLARRTCRRCACPTPASTCAPSCPASSAAGGRRRP